MRTLFIVVIDGGQKLVYSTALHQDSSDAKNRLKRLEMKRERAYNGATNLEIRFYMFGKNSDEYADYMNEPVDFRGI